MRFADIAHDFKLYNNLKKKTNIDLHKRTSRLL